MIHLQIPLDEKTYGMLVVWAVMEELSVEEVAFHLLAAGLNTFASLMAEGSPEIVDQRLQEAAKLLGVTLPDMNARVEAAKQRLMAERK